jgi:hypothetical protein
MPQGKGTYGTKVGRPSKKITKKRPTTMKPISKKMKKGMM